MWLRDSSAQVETYLPFYFDDPNLKQLFLGVLSRQANYILSALSLTLTFNSFQEILTRMHSILTLMALDIVMVLQIFHKHIFF